MEEVVLSDGKPCDVRRLGMFDLDEVRPELAGPYTYEVKTIDGRTFLAEYDGSRWPEPPPAPTKPHDEINEESDEWYDLVEYLRYNAWLLHEKERTRLMQDYHVRVVHYILENCISQEDRSRIVTPGDWAAIHKAAIVPELTLGVLAETLQATFQS